MFSNPTWGCVRLSDELKLRNVSISSANLQVRKRTKRHVAFGRGEPAIKATSVNERWSLDIVHDSLHSARRIRALTVADDFSRESLPIEVDTSISGTRMTAVVDRIADELGYPKPIGMDDTEMTSLAMLTWAASHRLHLHYIAPGKPTQTPLPLGERDLS